MSNFRAVIFDMDGVIIDSEPIYYRIQKQIFANLGITVTAKEYECFIGAGMHLMWSILKKNKHLKQSVEDLIIYNNNIIYESFSKMVDLSPTAGVNDFIALCSTRNLKIALASSTAKRTILAILKNLKLIDHFDVIVSGEEVPKGKPDPEIFLETAKKLALFPADCIVIEDSANGTRAAGEAGMYCIGLRNSAYNDQDLSAAHIVMDNFKQIGSHLFS